MKFHPYSEGPHLLSGADFDALVADIKDNGLREKIVLYTGKILDGRNRFLACQRAKVKPLYRTFRGSNADALKFAASMNRHRRHENESQRAMYASWLKEQFKSLNLDSDLAATAAEQMNVSRASVFHADKVRHEGSKELQRAVQSGKVAVSKAASVTDLPKSEQLSAATTKPSKDPEPPELSESWQPDADEEAHLAALDKELAESVDKVMAADDKLATAFAEIKRQASEIASLKLSRDGFMNGKLTITKLLKTEQRKCAKLQRENDDLRKRLGMPKRNGVEAHA